MRRDATQSSSPLEASSEGARHSGGDGLHRAGPRHPGQGHQPIPAFSTLDFDQAPFLVIWEATKACGLVCRHCRAEAAPDCDPRELSTTEAKGLLTQIHDMGTPVCVISGGDPLRRADLAELVDHGAQLGLRMATIPAATEDLTRERLVELRDAGLAQVAFSIDGSIAELHDNFRQVQGTFAKTLQAVAWAHELGIPVQINTTFAKYNQHDVDALIQLVTSLRPVFWEVFSLIPVGRGAVLQPLSAVEHERLFAKLHELSQRVAFVIKLTEAPHYRRYTLVQRERSGAHRATQASGAVVSAGGPLRSGEQASVAPERLTSPIPAQLQRDLSTSASFGARARGINAGKGFVFVSHLGEVYPSGFLPIAVGNIREERLDVIYRTSPLLQRLRDAKLLGGRCGQCEFGDVCGGSRARAFAVRGDPLDEDPACSYVPGTAPGAARL